MHNNPLFSNKLPRSFLLGGALAVSLAGCAVVPDANTSVQPVSECRIAPVTTASVTGGKRKPVDKMDQIRAVNDFARFESNSRHLSPAMQVHFEELLRECGR